MKKITTLLLLGVLTTGVAFANHNNQEAKSTTIMEALKMNDDTIVSIRGNIINKLSDDKYTFKDSTGTMTVDIDNDKWSGIASNTKDTLEISGEIEKKLNSTELDVEHIRKVSN